MDWILILLTSTLTVTTHPDNTMVAGNTTNAEVAGHFTSQADCVDFQNLIRKYHLLDSSKETVNGNRRARTFTATVCVADTK
jgi:hypothetical protein